MLGFATKIFINKDFKNKLYNAFKEDLETNNLQSEIKTFDGCFQQRTVRGSDMISLHSWAMAIDINASTEKLGQVKSTLSPKFIEIMLKNGLFWGGNYKVEKTLCTLAYITVNICERINQSCNIQEYSVRIIIAPLD